MSALENTLRELREPVPYDLPLVTGWGEWWLLVILATSLLLFVLVKGRRYAART